MYSTCICEVDANNLYNRGSEWKFLLFCSVHNSFWTEYIVPNNNTGGVF